MESMLARYRNRRTAIPAVMGPIPPANSLFRNILPLSHCGSRFYPDQARSPMRKAMKIRILGESSKKICGHTTFAKERKDAARSFRIATAFVFTGSEMKSLEHPTIGAITLCV
jgi:hypothetical protein